MNNDITQYKLIHVNTDETWDLLNKENVKVLRDHIFKYNDVTESFDMRNARYYSNNDIMGESVIAITAHLDKTNDQAFKKFINKVPNNFRLDVTINGLSITVFGRIGTQESEVDWGPNKELTFDFCLKTRFLEYEMFVGEGHINEDSGDVYDIGNYNIAKYSYLDFNAGEVRADWSGPLELNSYFIIEGTSTGDDIRIKIRSGIITGATTQFRIESPAVGNFLYNNIPGQIEMSVNGVSQLYKMDPPFERVFVHEINLPNNWISVEGLLDATIIIVHPRKVV